MTSHWLYIWLHMHYIWHLTHALWHHSTLLMTSKILYPTSHRLYLRAHPLYLCHHTRIIDHTTPIVCMYNTATICLTSCKLHMTLHPLFMISHNSQISLPLYLCHHTRTPVISSTVAGPILRVYWLYHTSYMCDMKHTIYMTSQEFYMTPPSLFMT